MSGNSTKKEKRSRSSSNEGNNSFVKNVTSRVTGMLPATIAKWFSSPSSSSNDMPKSNGSVVTGDATDSSTEDEAPESPVTIQPPAKRMRLSPPATYNHFSPNETSVSNIEALEPITPYNNTQSTHRAEYNSSFIALHIPKSEMSQEKLEKSTTDAFKPQHSISSASFGSGSRKRKSILDSPSSSEINNKAIEKTATNTPRDPMLPTFKPCLLGSPFYSGRTMYGGAAASYLNQSNVKQRKPTVINETTNRNNTISHSALRVMDLLEQYSSPLSDAKRIPIVSTNRTRENCISRLENLTQQQSSRSSYKTQELYVPSIASVLRLKQRSRLVNTTNVARQILASHSSTSDQPYVSFSNQKRVSPSKESTAASHNYTTKIKSRLTRTRRGDVTADITPEPVNLPAATLQIDQSKLLNFSFGISTSMPITVNTAPKTDSNPKITENSTAARANDNNPYQFSSPSRVSPSSSTVIIKTPDPEDRPKFTFGSPERSVVHTNSSERNEQIKPTAMASVVEKNENTPSKSKDWQCSDCWVYNNADIQKCVCCGGKKTAKNDTKSNCSVCKISKTQKNSEKCVDCDKTPMVNNSWSINKETENSKWKCDDCWISNDASAEKCVCCGAGKTKKVVPTALLVPNTSTADEDWKCNDCWIKNKKSVDKCAACGSGNPKAKQTSANTNSTVAPPSSDKTIKGLLKTQSDKWECPSCLVRNDKNRSQCVCCDSAKPGSLKQTEKKFFDFNTKTNETFKFGIDPTIQHNSLSKPVENKTPEGEPKEIESEKNNNVLPKTPSFTFGLPTKKIDEQLKPDKVNTGPTMTFTFGVPKSLSAESKSISPSAPPAFGDKVTEPTKLESIKSVETEKPQEVPKIDFASPTTDNDTKKKEEQKSGMLFSMPVRISKQLNDKVAPLVFGTPMSGNKDSPATTSTSTVTAKPVTSFTFSGSPAKPASPTKPASSTFGTPAPPSLFNDKTKTTTPSLFEGEKPKTPVQASFTQEKTASSSGPASTANATMFNFGNAVDKSKFNFIFGVQKSEAPAPMFGNTKSDVPAVLFGNTKTDSPAPLFGNSKTDGPASLFNNTKSDAQPSLFGNTKTDAQGPMFGASKNDTAAPLFGNTKTDASANLFANTPDTNLFSNSNKSDAPVFASAVKADNALFGSNAKTNPSLFGNASKSESPLFGNTPKPEPALFGNTNKLESPMFKFGGSAETSTAGNKFAGNIFGASPNDSTSGAAQPAAGMFASPKPASFSFGSTPVFGASSPTFGSNIGEPAPMFGSATSAPANNIFGASAASAPGPGLFGAPSPAGAPGFGTPNTTVPPFEASSLTPAPAPAFNFGATQNTGLFGFGQQQQTPPAGGGAGAPAAGGAVYTFGGGAGAAGAANLQFSLGAGAGAPGAAAAPRRVRKVARRNLR